MNQQEIVLDYIERNGGITSMEAFELGITRLSGVVFNLRKAGHKIKSNDETCVNRYGKTVTFSRYTLEPGQQVLPL